VGTMWGHCQYIISTITLSPMLTLIIVAIIVSVSIGDMVMG
jgi:hypothetical protein